MEEGEDDAATIDPDVALSYIDEKLQNVLGHLQKDFEGGVCAENLGAKFGGYGSFLPTYQRSPSVLSHSRSPHISANINGANNPGYFSQNEVSPLNNNTTLFQSTLDNKSVPQATRNPGYKDGPRKASSNQDFTPQHDSVSRSSNGSDQRTLKVRIKVGPESAPPRNNAAIYSRLGFDVSPVSSPEDSPEGSGGLVTRGQDSPNTPLTTFKFYSGLHAPQLVACLLSPIHENLLSMVEKKAPARKDVRVEENLSIKNDRSYAKSRKSNEKGSRFCDIDSNIKTGGSDKGSRFSDIDSNIKTGGNDKGSRFSDMDSNVNTGDSDVAAAINRMDGKISPRKERVFNSFSPPLPPHPKCDYENLVRQPVSERTKDSGVSKRPEKIVDYEGKLSPSRVVKEPQATGKFGNASAVSSKQKLSIESSSDERTLPHGGINHGAYRDPQKFVKAIDDKSSAIAKIESDGYTGTNDLAVGPAESVKLRAPQRTISYEEVTEMQEKVTSASVVKKKKIKGNKSNKLPKDKFKDYSNAASTTPSKERRSNAAPTGEIDSKLGVSKSEKDPNTKVSKERTGHTPIIKVKQADNRSKLGDDRFDHEGGCVLPGDRMKERVVQKKTTNLLFPQAAEKSLEAAPIIGNELAFDVVPPSADFWVQCDRCQKWRLLPPGVKPDDLSGKWVCNMLDWLPGMNKCSISEEETTQALRAPYQPLAPEGQVAINYPHYGTTSCVTSKDSQLYQDFAKANYTSAKSKKINDMNQHSLQLTQQNRGNLQHEDSATYIDAGKQKHKNAEKNEWQDHCPKKGDSFEKGSKSTKSKPRKEFDQDGTRTSKKLKTAEFSDVQHDWHSVNCNLSGERDFGAINDHSPEISAKYHKDNSMPKDFRKSQFQLSGEMVKVPDCTTENSEMKEDYANSSDTSKKRKIKQLHGSKGHPKADIRNEIQKESTEPLVRKEKKLRASKFDIRELNETKLTVESQRNRPMSGTPLSGNRDEFHLENAHDKQQDADNMYQFNQRNVNNVDNLKRDTGFCQASTAATSSSSKISGSCRSKTNLQEARGSPVESVSSSPLRTSATGKLTRRVDDTKNLGTFSKGSTGEYFSDIDGTYHHKQKASSAVHGGPLDGGRVLESGIMNPVNGVSCLMGKKTGPLSESKAQNILLSIFGHTDDEHSSEEDMNVGVGAIDTSEPPNNISSERDSKVYHDFHPDEHDSQNMFSNNCVPKQKQRNPEADVSDGKRKVPATASDQRDRKPMVSNGADARGRPTYAESSRPDKYNLEKIEKKTSSTKISGEQTNDVKKGNRSNSASGNYDVNGSVLPADKDRGLYNSVAGTAVASGNGEKSYLNEKVQEAAYKEDRDAPSQSYLDRMDKLNKAPVKSKKSGTSLPFGNKQDLRDVVPQPILMTTNGSHSAPLPDKTLTGTPVTVPKETSKSGKQNEIVSSSSMQLTPNRLEATGSSKRDAGISAANVLKEARDLKHTANRKKNEGLDNESTGLYFQAALKFLYGASLIERSNSESSKHGDPVQWYSQTAKLCEFCAHEYEKRKEMAAAALAYKCTEVAYMKVVYLKNDPVMKDRHELQTASQIGESPSSSASDVDNVNNQGVPDKTTTDKKNNTLQGPQPAGGLVIASRNRSSFTRILSFAEATNCAMEASRKSMHTLSLASSSINDEDKKGVEGLSSVQRTLDFCFHDIEGLLRLVRLAMELINR